MILNLLLDRFRYHDDQNLPPQRLQGRRDLCQHSEKGLEEGVRHPTHPSHRAYRLPYYMPPFHHCLTSSPRRLTSAYRLDVSLFILTPNPPSTSLLGSYFWRTTTNSVDTLESSPLYMPYPANVPPSSTSHQHHKHHPATPPLPPSQSPLPLPPHQTEVYKKAPRLLAVHRLPPMLLYSLCQNPYPNQEACLRW